MIRMMIEDIFLMSKHIINADILTSLPKINLRLSWPGHNKLQKACNMCNVPFQF